MLDDIEALLQSYNLGTPGSTLFQGQIPAQISTGVPTPDDVSALYEYGGSPPEHVKDLKAPILERSRFQVITRSASYPTGRQKIEQIYQLLAGYRGVLNGVAYPGIRALQNPFFLDRDDKNRARFVVNFEATKEVSSIS